MSDRFYTQMCEHFKVAPYELNIALRDHESPEFKKIAKKSEGVMSNGKKMTRIDLNNALTELLGVNIEGQKLSMPTLTTILAKVKAGDVKKVAVPEGRLKKPYQEAVMEAFGEKLDLDTATVKTMKTLLESINNV
ncbi:hypothetical protein [Klebsiella phage Kpn02]|uniref:Uncharacterized protein n=1 Tax=Klebsiella phage Kpn02 TaxID=3044023 RepID=A0AAT9V5X4_9CAUD|nr:hypothetical protein [Klebsiella phage Kpn02]